MSLVITSRKFAGVVIVDISGRMRAPDAALRAHFNEHLEEGHRAFVLNLADFPYIDSFGLGQLVSVWTSIQAAGGQLILLKPTQNIRKLLQITKLDSVLQIGADEAEAVIGALAGPVVAQSQRG